jgi:hypothetical protein
MRSIARSDVWGSAFPGLFAVKLGHTPHKAVCAFKHVAGHASDGGSVAARP